MSADNTVTLVGNVTKDPEIKFLNSGKAICNFGIAVNKRWMNRETQQWEEKVSFFDVACFDVLAENAGETLTKGMRIVVIGELEQRSWETPEGDKRSKVEVKATDVSPSLRWAQAVVTRNPKRDGGNGGGGGQQVPDAVYDID